MELKAKAKEAAVAHITEKALSGLGLLIGTAFWAGSLFLALRIVPALSPLTTALTLSTLLTAVLLETALVIYFLRKSRKQLTPRFGVLWSKDQAPHCPACSKPLGRFARFKRGGWGFWCVQCKQVVAMSDDTGRRLELAEAKQLLA